MFCENVHSIRGITTRPLIGQLEEGEIDSRDEQFRSCVYEEFENIENELKERKRNNSNSSNKIISNLSLLVLLMCLCLA